MRDEQSVSNGLETVAIWLEAKCLGNNYAILAKT